MGEWSVSVIGGSLSGFTRMPAGCPAIRPPNSRGLCGSDRLSLTVDIVPRGTNWVYLHVREGEREGLHSEVQYDVSCSARPQKCCYAQRSIRSWFSSVQAQANGQVMEGSEVLQGMEVGMRG